MAAPHTRWCLHTDTKAVYPACIASKLTVRDYNHTLLVWHGAPDGAPAAHRSSFEFRRCKTRNGAQPRIPPQQVADVSASDATDVHRQMLQLHDGALVTLRSSSSCALHAPRVGVSSSRCMKRSQRGRILGWTQGCQELVRAHEQHKHNVTSTLDDGTWTTAVTDS
jgi:hypothetical protein